MKTVKTIKEVRDFVNPLKQAGKTIALVPTMGYLHEGHLSLIKRAREENDIVVVSIFVNPTQFGENEDLSSYPKDLESDFKSCEEAGADLVFYPDADEMYKDHKTYIKVEDLSEKLCGVTRPIHFRGVATVCAKLFNISKADRAYFGQKDAQQFIILKKMVEDLNFDIELVRCPIVRNEKGLALSSRNKYLSDSQKEDALVLYKALDKAKEMLDDKRSPDEIIAQMEKIISEIPYAEIDYIKIVDLKNLEDVESIDSDVLVALAVKVGPARLIDNIIYEV
ncbi:MAG: pantoate--beta-alanine ligase [Finegoldia sp.]|nr:pantoate--beta-alanine ligase [Finegoldia sp.]